MLPLRDSTFWVQLVADDRELGDRRVEDVLLEIGSVLEDVAQERHHDQQEREEAEKAPVGEVTDELATVIIAELLPHRDDEGHRRVAALPAVEAAQEVVARRCGASPDGSTTFVDTVATLPGLARIRNRRSCRDR